MAKPKPKPGMCPRCSKQPPQPGKKLCPDCLEKERERISLRRAMFQMVNKCVKCGKRDPLPGQNLCRECAIKDREQDKLNSYKTKAYALQAYGGQKCSCCGETTMEFLTIVAANLEAAKMRGSDPTSGSGIPFFRWLRQHHWPRGFHVLCYNCNMAKNTYGICPHVKGRLRSGETVSDALRPSPEESPLADLVAILE